MKDIFKNLVPPPTAQLLGWELIDVDVEQGAIRIAFHPDERMLNPRGTVQGGIVAAMLDDTMVPALYALTGGQYLASTIDLNVSFIRPVQPGRVIAEGRVVNRGRSVVFMEAELLSEDGKLLARATSSGIPIELAK
ncbi:MULTISPECIES: PaaI family thioesterase [unclassified Brucella]|uniref:PaaI family thioesterase n=1 Tax=unclassified Brucella TaxID=2632610 RepID=UPI000D0372FF|nr:MULTISPECIES: PaaI family thioesterase [unclassified Brucella]